MPKRGQRPGVGYKRPPRHTQFKPGESGNKKGRPKKSNTFLKILDEELRKSETFNVKGVPKRLKFDRVIAQQAIVHAAKGNLKPLADLFKISRVHEHDGTVGANSDEVFNRDEDRLVIDSVVRRIRQLDPLPAPLQASADAAPITDETPPLPNPSTEEKS